MHFSLTVEPRNKNSANISLNANFNLKIYYYNSFISNFTRSRKIEQSPNLLIIHIEVFVMEFKIPS